MADTADEMGAGREGAPPAVTDATAKSTAAAIAESSLFLSRVAYRAGSFGTRTALNSLRGAGREIAARPNRGRTPIVLMHGFLGFRRIGPLAYFQSVPETLALMGFPVYTPIANPLNTYEYRAYEWFYGHPPDVPHESVPICDLDSTYVPRRRMSVEALLDPWFLRHSAVPGIAAAFLRHRTPIHLIAHSQACIDARYLTAPEGLGNWKPFASGRWGDDVADTTIAECIASVTTIAGPHNGVLIADDTHAVNAFMERYLFPAINGLVSLWSHDASDLWRSAREFGAEYMLNEFNPNHSEAENVRYHSIAGVTNEYQVNRILEYFYRQTRFSDRYERSDNDGFVPLGSTLTRHGRDGVAAKDLFVGNLLKDPLEPTTPLDSNGRWMHLGTVYADHINQIGIPVSMPRNTIFRHLPMYHGIARYLAGELKPEVRLHPDGRWRVPRAVPMLPQLEPEEPVHKAAVPGA